MLYQLWFVAWIMWWKSHPPLQTSFMQHYAQTHSGKTPIHYHWINYPNMSIYLKRAVVASEDDKFLSHHGFDWHGLRLALDKNLQRGTTVAGGSTISQQLAKNLFLQPTKSYLRKFQEAIITLMLETLWDKQKILATYLNVVEWGEGIYGCEAAAQYYYHTSCSQLDINKAARLAVILPNPKKWGQHMTPYQQYRQQQIIQRMNASQIP